MNKEEIRTTIHSYINAYNGFDIDSMLEVLAPDVRFENISGGEVNVKHLEKLSLKP